MEQGGVWELRPTHSMIRNFKPDEGEASKNIEF